jgi:selenocysteine-specific elongation factor
MIIGTAGHIDHGKSALVTALTGRPMDRLAEERRRGITIDLNFAPLRFDGLPPAGIVDVPGHEDFVRTMVAGASGIDLVLLVVDAVQGPQPQTWEHLAIVEQLRIPRGIPVVTKSDLADPEWTELVTAELMERLERSGVKFGSPVIASAVTGTGIAELRARLRGEIEADPRRESPDGFRMPIDRVFSLAGVGTVLTGTPWSGGLGIGDSVTILPRGLSGRVRSLEAYGAPIDRAVPGARTAIGLAGIDREEITRGDVLVAGAMSWQPTRALDARLELLRGSPPLPRRARVRIHLGTAEVLGRVHPRGELLPGGSAEARIALETPVVARGGDRLVLRSYSPVVTIGGGMVLDPLPPRRAPWPEGIGAAEPEPRLSALVTRRSRGAALDELPLLLGLPDAACRELALGHKELTVLGSRVLARTSMVRLREEAVRRVERYHQEQPTERGLSLETLRRVLKGQDEVIQAILAGLIRRGELQMAEGLVSLPGFTPRLVQGRDTLEQVLSLLDAAGLAPPSVEELEQQEGLSGVLGLLRFAAQDGRVIAVERNRYFSPRALSEFLELVRELAGAGSLTPVTLRERTGLSRKFLIPLLEYSDRVGVTRRVGDGRVLGGGR